MAAGYSNGASIAASLMLLRPEAIFGAALLRPSVPLVPEPLPHLAGRPVLVAAGRADSVTPASNAAAIISFCATHLKQCHKKAGNDPMRDELLAVRSDGNPRLIPSAVLRLWQSLVAERDVTALAG